MSNDYTNPRAVAKYKLRALEQTEQWVNGIARHNIIDNECCPDFSCCIPELFEHDREKRAAQLDDFCRRHNFQNRMDS